MKIKFFFFLSFFLSFFFFFEINCLNKKSIGIISSLLISTIIVKNIYNQKKFNKKLENINSKFINDEIEKIKSFNFFQKLLNIYYSKNLKLLNDKIEPIKEKELKELKEKELKELIDKKEKELIDKFKNNLNNEKIQINKEEQKNQIEILSKTEKYLNYYDFLQNPNNLNINNKEIIDLIKKELIYVNKYFSENYGEYFNIKEIRNLEKNKKEYFINNQKEEYLYNHKLILFNENDIKINKNKILNFTKLIILDLNNNNNISIENKIKFINLILLICIPPLFINNKEEIKEELNSYLDIYLKNFAFDKKNDSSLKDFIKNIKYYNKNFIINNNVIIYNNSKIQDIFKKNDINFKFFYLNYIFIKHFNEFKKTFFNVLNIEEKSNENYFTSFLEYFYLNFNIKNENKKLPDNINNYLIARFDFAIRFFINNYNNLVELYLYSKIKNNSNNYDFFKNFNKFENKYIYNLLEDINILKYFTNNISNNNNISINNKNNNNNNNNIEDFKIEDFKKNLNFNKNNLNNENIQKNEEEQKNEIEIVSKTDKYINYYYFLQNSKKEYINNEEIIDLIENELIYVNKYFSENYGTYLSIEEIKILEKNKKEYFINNQKEEYLYNHKLIFFNENDIKINKSKILNFIDLIILDLNNNKNISEENKIKIINSILLFCIPAYIINNKEEIIKELNECLSLYIKTKAFDKTYNMRTSVIEFFKNLTEKTTIFFNDFNNKKEDNNISKNSKIKSFINTDDISFEYFYFQYIFIKNNKDFKKFKIFFNNDNFSKFKQYMKLKFHIQYENTLLSDDINNYFIFRFDYAIKFFINNYNNLVESYFYAKIKNNSNDFFNNAFSHDHCYNYQASELTTYLLQKKSIDLNFQYVFKEDKDIKNIIINYYKKYKDELNQNDNFKKYKNDDEIYNKIILNLFDDLKFLIKERFETKNMHSGNYIFKDYIRVKFSNIIMLIIKTNDINNNNIDQYYKTLKENFKLIIDNYLFDESTVNNQEEIEEIIINKNIDENIIKQQIIIYYNAEEDKKKQIKTKIYNKFLFDNDNNYSNQQLEKIDKLIKDYL